MVSTGTGTTAAAIASAYQAQKEHFALERGGTGAQRAAKLKKMKAWITSHRQEIQQALYQDFRKPASEVDLSEILVVTKEIDHTLSGLRSWMRPKKVGTPLHMLGSRSRIYYEPKGVCLIISPWNFPFNLTAGPLVSAIAAGNCCILKPSEMTPHTSGVIKKMVSEIFEPQEVCVFEGDQEVSAALLKLPFDHIFFTGSPAVGKVVMKAAAENLTSVTLELGGKSPVVIDETADLADAADKIVWGKFINNGQTCIAPDYILIRDNVKDEFLRQAAAKITKMFDGGQGIENSPDYARVINHRHFKRLESLLHEAVENGAKVETGGRLNESERFIEPTLLSISDADARVMNEEIFGPLLPLVAYKELPQALDVINAKEKPLALYIFSRRQKNIDLILARTSSGGVCINETDIHFFNPNLPFGGVNNSGIGKGHGHTGFLAFSNEKSVLRQRVGLTGIKLLYPPYTPRVKKMIDLVMKYL